MKRKAIALLLSLTMLSLSTTAYAADTVQNAPTINSSGKVVAKNTNIIIDSKDLTDLASAFNNNADILSDAQNNIATSSDEYSSSKTYKKNSLCIRNGQIYQCTTDITIAESWNDSHWKRVSISDSINSLYGDMESLKKYVSEGKSAIASAITEMGVSTESDATFETIVNNINSISNKKTVVNLGRSSTYSVTSYPGYQNFTVANNFLVGTYSASASSRWDDDSGNWSRSCSSSTNQTVSYNASTGVLTVKINRSNGSKSDHVGEISGSISGNQPNVWLVY